MALKKRKSRTRDYAGSIEQVRKLASDIVDEQCDGSEDFATRSAMMQSVLEQAVEISMDDWSKKNAENR